MEMNKQKEIYEFLKDYTENKGYPPSVREICEAVDLSSTSTVHGHLKRLEKKGLIKRDPSKPRALEIIDISVTKEEMVKIPIVKCITDIDSIFNDDNVEGTLSLPLECIKNNRELFMFRIFDNSMINIGIKNNDLVIAERSENAKNGEIIIIEIDNKKVIKKFFKEKDSIRLESENHEIEPIFVSECKIIGKLVGTYNSIE